MRRVKSKKMKMKFIALTVLCLLSFSFANAQVKITGVVLDGDQPLPAASVYIKGTSRGTVTDFDGNFELIASPTETLVISYLGYTTKEVLIADKTKFTINLKADSSTLDEIVVIGYGSVQRKDLTGSVVSIKAEEIDKVKAVSFEGAIAGKAAGVQVVSSEGGPGASFKIRVRGGTSINASNDPLYVIDGFAIDGSARSTGLGNGNSSTSPLASIDPSTIESIEVLKDASATAIYGSRGANGVIIITTKKGKKGRADFNFESYMSFETISKKIDLLSAQEFVDFRLEYTPFDPDNPGDQFVGAFRDNFGNEVGFDDPRVILTDWQDEITQTAITQNYKLSSTGGSDNSSYAGTFSYINQEGIIRTSSFERYNGNLRINQNITDKFRTGISANIGFNKTGGVVSAAAQNANGRSGIVTNAVLFSPVQGLTRLDGAEYDENGRLISLRNGDISNPNVVLANDINNGTAFNVYSNTFVEYDILSNLKFRSSIRLNTFAGKNRRYFSEKYGWGASANGRAFIGTYQGTGITTEQNLTYNKSFGKHRINAVAVYEQQETNFENLIVSSNGFDLPGVNLDNLETATVTNPTRSLFSDNTLQSYLTRIQYDYDNRFTVNFSARYDGSSRFAEGNKFGFFPSVGVAWKVNNEKFLKDVDWVSNLKLKASYGETGNTAIGSYRSVSQAGLASAIFNGGNIETGAAITQLANKELTWETTTQTDVGLSLGLFKNRLNIEADYYRKITTDLLLEVPLPVTTGFRTVFKNLGSLSNEGFELAINSVNIQSDDFEWSTNFNISFNKNRVLDLGEANQFFVTAIGDNQITDDYIIRVGESLGSVYGFQVDGVYNYKDFAAFDGLNDAQAAEKIFADAAAQGVPYYRVFYSLKDDVVLSSGQPNRDNYRPGMPKFADQLTIDTNGDGIPDAGDGIVNSDDRTIIGTTVPKFFGGMTNNFSYKNFDLSVLTSWVYGNDIYNKNIKQNTAQAIPFFNKYGLVRDRWRPDNPNTNIVGIFGDTDGGIPGNAYSDYIEDGSFIRLANITLGYKLNNKTVKQLGLKSCRVYGSIDNLYVWTKYSGFDPDVSVGNNQLTPGLDIDSYPRARTFRLGVNVGF